MKKLKYILFLLILIFTSSMIFACTGFNNIPVVNDEDDDTEQEIVLDETNVALKSALVKLLYKGFTTDFALSYSDISVKGSIDVYLSSEVIVKLQTSVLQKDIACYLHFTEEQDLLFVNFDKYSVYLNINNIGDIISYISGMIGMEDSESVQELTSQISEILNNISLDTIAPTIFDLINNVTGEKKDDGSYFYNFEILENLKSEIYVNSNKAFDKISLGYKLGEDNLNFSLSNFLTISEKPEIPTQEDSTDVESLLPLLKAIIDNKVTDVNAVVNKLLTINKEKIKEIIESKAISIGVELEYNKLEVKGKVNVSFSNKIAVSYKGNINGVEIEAYYKDKTLYIIKDGINIKVDKGSIEKYIKIFTKEEDTSIIDKISNIELKDISIYEDKIRIEIFDIVVLLDVDSLKVSIEYNGVEVSSEIEKGEEVEIVEAEYTDASKLEGLLEEINNQIKEKDFNIDGSININGIKVELKEVKVKVRGEGKTKKLFDSGLIDIEGTVCIAYKGNTYSVKVSYISNVLYIEVSNSIKLRIDKDNIESIIKEVKGNESLLELPNIKEYSIKDIIDSLKTIETGTNEIKVSLDLSKFKLGEIEIKLGLEGESNSLYLSIDGEKLSGKIGVNNTKVEISELDKEEYIDLGQFSDLKLVVNKLLTINKEKIKEIIESKAISIGVELEYNKLEVKGKVNVSFSNKIAVSYKGSINGVEIEAYYKDKTLYIIKDGINIKVDKGSIERYIKIFTKEEDTSIIDKISNIELKDISIYEDKIRIEISDIVVLLDTDSLKVSIEYNGVEVSSEIEKGEEVEIVEAEYTDASKLEGLLEEINNQIKEKDFNIDGSININGIKVELKEVKVKVKGEGKTKKLFDSGLIDIEGTVSIAYKGNTYKFDIVFFNNKLYIMFNDYLKVFMDRPSMDGIVDVINKNSDNLIEGLAIAGVSSMKDIQNGDYSISKLVSFVKTIDLGNNILKMNIDLSKFELGIAKVELGLTEDNSLYLNIGGENSPTGTLRINNNETIISAPQDVDKYMDLSNIQSLVDGLVVTALKESRTYSLKGVINIKFNSEFLNILTGANINVKVEAYVRIKETKDSNGNITKKIDAYITWDATDLPKLITTSAGIHDKVMKFGKATLTYTNDEIYISRMNMKYEYSFPLGKYVDGSTEYKEMTSDEFEKDPTKVIFYFLGIYESLMTSSGESTDSSIAYEKLLLGYNYDDKNILHNISLNLNELTKSSMLSKADIAIHMDSDKYLDSMKIVIPITLSIVGMEATLNATHDVKAKYDFETCFKKVFSHTYQNFF